MSSQEKVFPVRSRLDEAIDQLDEREKEFMRLWLAGRSLPEIIAGLGMTERAAQVLRASAVRRLRELIVDLGPPHGPVSR